MASRYEICMKSELDLFTVPKLQTSALKTEEIPYKPLASLDNASTLEFLSVGQGDTYRDLSNIYLKLQCKVVKSDKTHYVEADAAEVGLVNNVLHSLFQQVTIYLGNRAISVSDNNYAYRAYLESLLNYGSDAMDTHMESCGFYVDTPGQLDNLLAKQNLGLDKRKANYAKSATVELIGKIHSDMMNQQKFLLNNVDLRIVMSLNKPEFYTLETPARSSQIVITDATLFINHVTISPSVLVSHERVLAKSNAFYPYTRVECKSYTVAAGSMSLSLDNVVIGTIPRFILFGMVENEAYIGSRAKNPFNFQHFNINLFYLTINGSQVPMQPLTFDFDKTPPQSMRAYSNLFKSINMNAYDRANVVTKSFFDNGAFLLGFDLTSDLSASSDCTSLMNQGTIRIEGRFGKALPKTITCLIYCEYDAICEIDRLRNVYVA